MQRIKKSKLSILSLDYIFSKNNDYFEPILKSTCIEDSSPRPPLNNTFIKKSSDKLSNLNNLNGFNPAILQTQVKVLGIKDFLQEIQNNNQTQHRFTEQSLRTITVPIKKYSQVNLQSKNLTIDHVKDLIIEEGSLTSKSKLASTKLNFNKIKFKPRYMASYQSQSQEKVLGKGVLGEEVIEEKVLEEKLDCLPDNTNNFSKELKIKTLLLKEKFDRFQQRKEWNRSRCFNTRLECVKESEEINQNLNTTKTIITNKNFSKNSKSKTVKNIVINKDAIINKLNTLQQTLSPVHKDNKESSLIKDLNRNCMKKSVFSKIFLPKIVNC